MSNPLVSIIIGNYNKGRWLTEALFSAFGQTYSPIEVVLYDDGSTDQSPIICSAFSEVPNFIYSRGKECSGRCSVSYARALALAKGEYVAFLGSDDILTPYHVEDLMVEAIKDPKIDFLFSNLLYIDENNKVIGGPFSPQEDTIFDKCSIGLVTSIVKRSVLMDVGGFDEALTFSEDWELIIKLFKAGAVRKYVDVAGFLGRRTTGEATMSKVAGSILPNFSDKRRIESHTYIRKKHNLLGPCKCGCGVGEIVLPPIEGDPRISASMIVRDEETVLEECLRSIVGIDEIVILDTGSIDGTAEIAQRYTKMYYADVYKWNDNFADARNESLKRCTGDWILIIDADEYLEQGGVQKIRELTKNIPANISAIGFKTIAKNGNLMHESVRLFRNNIGVQWHGPVHNYLSVRSQYSSDISLYYGYSPAHAKDPDRSFRILTKEIEKNPSALRERFYLAREYYYRQKWEEAIEHYRIYLEKAHWPPEKAEAWMQVSRCYNNVGMNFEARLACLRALEINADFKDALNWMGALSQDPEAKKKWEEYATLAGNSNTLFCSTR
jgi:glycosyltransferase involved in cell wall biosynthesis